MYDFLFKFVIVGDKNTGKTTLLKKYLNSVIPTIGVDFISTDIILNSKTFRLHIWDTSGNLNFLNIIQVYLKSSIGAIIVFNLNDIDSFNNIDFWIQKINTLSNDYKKLIIIGTHHDLPRKISYEMIHEKCFKYNIEYFETNEHFQIEHCFMKIIKNIMQDYQIKPNLFFNLEGIKSNIPQKITLDYINFDNNNENNDSCCKNCSIL